MADWYVSSAVYATIAQWAATHAYSIGDLIKPLANIPANSGYVYRCTTAGTSGGTEPASWATTNNGTTTSGGATFTNVTGQSTYAWSAPAGTLFTMAASVGSRVANGDRVFVSSDHSETNGATATYAFGTGAYALVQVLSVNRAGSVPPVAADLQTGAAITASATDLRLDNLPEVYFQGISFTVSGTAGNIAIGATGAKGTSFKNCAFALTNASNSAGRIISPLTNGRITLDNCTVRFSNTAQYIGGATAGIVMELIWLNTASAIQGSIFPTSLFTAGAQGAISTIVCRGVDLSAITGTLLTGLNTPWNCKVLLDSCQIASSVTRHSPTGTSAAGITEELELVNCYDGTNVLNERYTVAGNIITDRGTYLSGGAQDDVGNYSLKMSSNARSDFVLFSLDCFAFDVENAATGASKTATVEIVSSASLNNNDIRLLLEYMGTSGNPIASFGDSLASVLTAASALPSSSNTWNSPPATPQKQLLQVTFTPQRAGRVRGLVRLGKVSTTVWVNPQIAIS